MALQEISRRIDVLTRKRAAERKRLLKPGLCEQVQDSCRRMIEFLEVEIAGLEKSWVELLGSCQDLLETHRHLLTVPGVGKVLARVTISEMYVVERARSSGECVAYAGLAPQEQTSGTSLKKQSRTFSTGNKRLRTALYMSAIALMRHDHLCRDLYARLVGAGKPPKVAIVAIMAKTMRRIAAVANRQTPWIRA